MHPSLSLQINRWIQFRGLEQWVALRLMLLVPILLFKIIQHQNGYWSIYFVLNNIHMSHDVSAPYFQHIQTKRKQFQQLLADCSYQDKHHNNWSYNISPKSQQAVTLAHHLPFLKYWNSNETECHHRCMSLLHIR